MRRTLLIAAVLPVAALLAIAACSGNTLTGGGPCSTCADVYDNGGIVCGPGDNYDAWQMLDSCACGNTCLAECYTAEDGGANLCTNGAANSPCNTCLMNNCTAALAACASN
jgi:hypothetical protein